MTLARWGADSFMALAGMNLVRHEWGWLLVCVVAYLFLRLGEDRWEP